MSNKLKEMPKQIKLNLEKYCGDGDLKYIISLPRYVQLILELYVTNYINSYINTGKKSPVRILKLQSFLNPFTVGYMPKIKNINQTCWVSTSLWFVSSMRLLIESAKSDTNQHGIINFLLDKMKLNSEISQRVWAAKTVKDFETCIVNLKDHRIGEQDDAGANINDIIYQISPDIKDKLLYNVQFSTERKVLIDYGYADDNTLSAMIVSTSRTFNAARDQLIKYVKKTLSHPGRTAMSKKSTIRLEIFNRILLPRLSEEGVLFNRALNYWPGMYEVITGKRNNTISSFEQFCNETAGYNLHVCMMEQSLKNYSALATAKLNPHRYYEPKNYEMLLQIYKNTTSIQQAMDESLEVKVEKFAAPFDEFDIIRQRYIEHHTLNVTYIIIKLKYESEWDPEIENIVVNYPKIVIDPLINVDHNVYTLTAVAMKSGDIGGGHWWTEIRENPYSDPGKAIFREYNDLANNNVKLRDLNFISRLDTDDHRPQMLCYTLLSKIVPN
jgi:hypothetical protein